MAPITQAAFLSCILLYASVSNADTCKVYCPDGSTPTQSCDSTYDPCPSSGSSSSSGSYSGPGQTNEELWAERPNILQGLFMWPFILVFDVIFVPYGMLEGLFDGGEFKTLDRVGAMTWNYCPLVIAPRALVDSAAPNS